MKRKIFVIVMMLVLCITPMTVFADDECYGNPMDYDEWGDPIYYGGHDWDYIYTEDATCVSQGWDEYMCTYCGETEYRYIPPTGHNWSYVDLVESPTSYNTLIWGIECENEDCDEAKYSPIRIKKGKRKKLWTKKETKSIKKLTNRKIKWSSSKKKVATVKSGVVKARKRGTAYITAKVWVKKYHTWVKIKYQIVVK